MEMASSDSLLGEYAVPRRHLFGLGDVHAYTSMVDAEHRASRGRGAGAGWFCNASQADAPCPTLIKVRSASGRDARRIRAAPVIIKHVDVPVGRDYGKI